MYMKVQTKTKANTNEINENKDELVDSIIENNSNQFDESDRVWMQATDTDVLKKMLPANQQQLVEQVANEEVTNEEPLVVPKTTEDEGEEEEEESEGVENVDTDAPLTVPEMNFGKKKK